ncbi:holo-ACP synthase [Janibacter sp. DB-40]|uniref:holo-ACP synthase n=1 Tax=Janibacter sp. DB-40 TaxID=3028808 RepID=UPI00240592BE|nr:holo-ACP synthase [Janibacter sp. DB-40]
MADLVGVGTDVVDVARIERLVSRGGRRFLERWFRTAEIDYCLSGARAVRVAALLAAKEAAVKSLGAPGEGPVPWKQIEVTHDPATGLRLHGSMYVWAVSAGGLTFHVTTAHTPDLAMATVIALRSGQTPA